MITKEQAMNLEVGDYIIQTHSLNNFSRAIQKLELFPDGSHGFTLPKTKRWKINGKVKTWKRDTNRFEIPLKHGLLEFGYLTNKNCYLFKISK